MQVYNLWSPDRLIDLTIASFFPAPNPSRSILIMFIRISYPKSGQKSNNTIPVVIYTSFLLSFYGQRNEICQYKVTHIEAKLNKNSINSSLYYMVQFICDTIL
ncbi:hypothetical protein ABZP36_026464 [Zizania latifolia]